MAVFGDTLSIFIQSIGGAAQLWGKALPPKPASQFLLGSTPTQLEPGLSFLVLRHIRFWKSQSNSSKCVIFTLRVHTLLTFYLTLDVFIDSFFKADTNTLTDTQLSDVFICLY